MDVLLESGLTDTSKFLEKQYWYVKVAGRVVISAEL